MSDKTNGDTSGSMLSTYEAGICEKIVNIRANRVAKLSSTHPIHWDTTGYLERQQEEAARRLIDYKNGTTQPAIRYPSCFTPAEIFFVEQLHLAQGWNLGPQLEDFVRFMAEAMPEEPIQDVSHLIDLINDKVIPEMAKRYN